MTFAILVKKRLSIAADIVCESRRHSKPAVHESGRRGHRQRIDLRCADRGCRVWLKDVLCVPRHTQAIGEGDHVLDPGTRSSAHRRGVAPVSYTHLTLP